MPIHKDPNVPPNARFYQFENWVRLTADTLSGGLTCIYNGYSKPHPLPGRSIKRITDMGNHAEVYIECCLGLDMGTYSLDASVDDIVQALRNEGLAIPEIVKAPQINEPT